VTDKPLQDTLELLISATQLLGELLLLPKEMQVRQ